MDEQINGESGGWVEGMDRWMGDGWTEGKDGWMDG